MTLRVRPKSGTQILDTNMNLLASRWETSLIERILKVTQSPRSPPFYRRAIATLGEGIVDQEYGELRHRTRLGEVNNPAKYFNALLKKRLEAVRNPRSLEELGSSGSPPWTNGRPPPQDYRSIKARPAKNSSWSWRRSKRTKWGRRPLAQCSCGTLQKPSRGRPSSGLNSSRFPQTRLKVTA